MTDIEKYLNQELLLKEYYQMNGKLKDIPELSSEEIRQLYNSSENKNFIYSNFGKGN